MPPCQPTSRRFLAAVVRPALAVLAASMLLAGPIPGRAESPEEQAATTAAYDKVIQQEIRAGWERRGVQPASRCDDRVFVRRLSLDLLGRIPTTREVETYLADGRADRRAQLVRHLLQSEDYVHHFADVFDTLLMGRGKDRDYDERQRHHWRSYLEGVFRDDRAWNEVVRELLMARPNRPEERGSVWFLYERKDDAQRIAEAVAPGLFGFRIECAQCHDHPLADEIEQRHYWGLVAFFNRGKNVQTKNGPRISESAIGGFSDFADLAGGSSPNLLAFLNAVTIDEPRPAAEQKQSDEASLYVPAPVEGDPRVPKFSRREKFATEVAAAHPLIARAVVNRVWAIMMGRGIVHPFNEMDSVHLPSHPELLDRLTEIFVDSGQQIRPLVEAIAQSEAYQLRSDFADNAVGTSGASDPAAFSHYLERPLTAEQLARSFQIALRGTHQNDHPLTAVFRPQFPDVLPPENISTVKEAMFLSNNSAVEQFLQGSFEPKHLLASAADCDAPDRRAEMMFAAILHRSPTDEELARLQQFWAASKDRRAGIAAAAWALLTSAEFRFNH
ncbi:MAG: DUF1549 domain-containing protein [Planctomycetales bacterium]|nr:DUF1549 domain-containing protein [Planctomycetales bacterium]